MKPNKLQKEIIDMCISELYFWKDSNDINSPTHACEINSIFTQLIIDDKITTAQAIKLSDSLFMLWSTIKQLNNKQE